MAEKQYGGSVPVDFGDVRYTLLEKLDHHRKELTRMLGDNIALHDFEEFNAEVGRMQATIRTLDVLNGHVDIHGFLIEGGNRVPDNRVTPDKLAAAVENKLLHRSEETEPEDTPR